MKDTSGAAVTTTLVCIALAVMFLSMKELGESTAEYRYENKDPVAIIVEDAEEIKSDHENIDVNQLQEKMDHALVQTAFEGGKICAGIYDDFFVLGAIETFTEIFSNVEMDASEKKEDIIEPLQEQPSLDLQQSAKEAVKNKVIQKVELGTSTEVIEDSTNKIWQSITDAASLDVDDIDLEKKAEDASKYCEQKINSYLEEQKIKADEKTEEQKKQYQSLLNEKKYLEEKIDEYESLHEELGLMGYPTGYETSLERLKDLEEESSDIDEEMEETGDWQEFIDTFVDGQPEEESQSEEYDIEDTETVEDTEIKEDADIQEEDQDTEESSTQDNISEEVTEQQASGSITLYGNWGGISFHLNINLDTGSVSGSGSGTDTMDCPIEVIGEDGNTYQDDIEVEADISGSISGHMNLETRSISGTVSGTMKPTGGECGAQSFSYSFSGKLSSNLSSARGRDSAGNSWSCYR